MLVAVIVGSPSKLKEFEQCKELLKSMVVTQQQKLAAAWSSQFMVGASFAYNKCINFFFPKENDTKRYMYTYRVENPFNLHLLHLLYIASYLHWIDFIENEFGNSFGMESNYSTELVDMVDLFFPLLFILGIGGESFIIGVGLIPWWCLANVFWLFN